ncbi:MAG: multicopper oxidase domain-containing protein [Chloroflexi bacterium]|nr:multicopper oxidase domain-containing protein [Chloroflexota bacterium]
MANIATRRLKPGLLLAAGALIVLILFLALNGRSQKVSASHLNTIACNQDATVGSATFDLETGDDYILMPDGNTLYSWGYNLVGESFQYPGPTLCVEEGDVVTINLTNNLPELSSIVFRGQTGVTASGDSDGLFTAEAAASGGTATYSFVADKPGTYLYESGTNPYKQIEMGLFGALVVYPAMNTATEHYAYNHVATQYNPEREYLLLLHEIDPNLRQAVERGEPYDITTKHDRYWTINGRSNPDTLFGNDVPWLPNQPYGSVIIVEPYDETLNPLPALIRYANAGLENHPFHPHGNNLRVIGRDGRLLRGAADEDLSLDGFTTTVASGQTYDLLAAWHNLGDGDFSVPHPWDPATNPLPENPAGIQYPGLYNQVDLEDSFYSGSPYLGYQDDRLMGTIPYNLCGEFYYPWHSHALHEIQNFDEGFGGMLTAWVVLPLGGCP